MYVPSPGTTTGSSVGSPVSGFTNLAGTFVSTSPLNSGVFDCGVFLAPSDTTSFVVVLPNTVGV